MWFFKMLRWFFFGIDKIIFNFIPEIYDLLIDIARTSVLTQADIKAMSDRIYSFLIIFMVFKVTLSLITYVVNPDEFSDKSKGISKLSTNIIISLSLLILTPYLFRYAYQFQTIILEDNSLGNLIFGDNGNNDFLNTAGEEMAFIAMTPFFMPDTSIRELHSCVNLTETSSDGSVVFNSNCSGLGSDMQPTDASNTMYDFTVEGGGDGDFHLVHLQNYVTGVQVRNLRMMFRKEMAEADDGDGNFIIDYKYIVSTAVGVVMLLLLITFCMDIAVRSIKLAFLQLIAPIPIISYVDPKSGKDGLFKKWYQMCFKTFLSLFMRILALYFAIYIISRVADWKLVDVVDGSYKSGFFLAIFIIIGALMFAKQLPKILEGLGIKVDSEGFTLNPFKKFEKEALGGKQILSAGGALAAGGAAFATNLIARKGNVFSAAAGAVSATGRGLVRSLKGEGFGKTFSNSYGTAMKNRVNRADRKALGISAFDVAKENVRSALRIPNDAEKNKAKLDHFKDYISSGKNVKTRAEGEVDKKASQIVVNGKNLGALRDKYEILKNTQIKRSDYTDDASYQAALEAHAEDAAKANAEYFAARKKAVGAYVSNAQDLNKATINMGADTIAGFDSAFDGSDTIITSNLQKMQQLNTDYNMNQNVKADDIGKTIQKAEDEETKIKTSREYSQAELIAQQAQKEKGSK